MGELSATSGRIRMRSAAIWGSVTVEMALVAPILILLLFGIIEFGLLFKDMTILRQAAREGARAAAVGATTSEIQGRIESSLATLDTTQLEIELKYRTYSSGWSNWDSAPHLGNIGSGEGMTNDAPAGAQIRVALTYPHTLVSGRLFSQLADDPESQTMTLTASSIMRRE